ncbi:MAG: type IX secretion system sortase PorU [Bacteroidales bacterium]|jgi:hypothetical protein|nr:type IX secretion system sortase PorU [Bacteroidales bacterium]
MKHKVFFFPAIFVILMFFCCFNGILYGFSGNSNNNISNSSSGDFGNDNIISTASAMPATNSKLSQGKTLKIATDISGIYRVNYSDLTSAGLISAPVSSSNIALYGNRAGILSRINDSTLYDDLQPLPIEMHDDGDGTFNQGDYFIFYGQSPLLWEYTDDTLRPFKHQFNFYSNHTCYFVSASANETPKRIQNMATVTATPQITISSFTDYILHENEIKNICNSGLNWVGELFSANGVTESFSFNLPDIDLSENVIYSVQTAVADYSSSTRNASFSLTVGQQEFPVNTPSAVSDCAGLLSATVKIPATSSSVRLQLTYNKTIAGGGYLDFIEIQYTRSLVFPRSGEIIFRSPKAIGKIARYNISGASKVWDVTDPLSVKAYTIDQNSFTANTADHLQEYVAFDGTGYHTPIFLGITDTQNLHNAANPDLIIVSHPDFIEQAEKVSQIHRERDGIDVLTANVQFVYNEFSSGSKDPSAIRLLAKMFYDRYKQDSITYKKPRYLLLFGNASVDPKDINGTTTDFVPTFETYRSTDRLGVSFSSPMEDAFAYLDYDEGNTDITGSFKETGVMDIAVGRIPAKSKAEAIDATEKIDIYTSPYYLPNSINPFKTGNFGSWRNTVTFIADDNDGFVESYEGTQFGFGPSIYTNFPNINFEKIYSDAYRKVSTSVASKYPEAHQAILDRINGGGLFLGYIGHSGWSGCADEGLMSVNDIDELWETTYSFPIMFFSSCSASPFDRTDQNSIGEQAVLFPHGGAIAVIASPRENFKNYIEKIQADFVASLVTQNETKDKTIGDAFLYAKQRVKNLSGFRFVLLGDPALRVPLPKYNVVTTHINGVPVTEEFDTLSAYSTITVDGYISRGSISGNDTFTEFNGILQVSVFDKLLTEQTLGNPYSKGGAPNPIINYLTQKNLLYQGQAIVTNGVFSFAFIVPKDISYNYGFGKISYYAYSDSLGDASGYFNEITVGGFNNDVTPDTLAPEVHLYIDHNGFIDGSTVGKLPHLYAEISDRYGINTTGTGIGHDMELIIDGDEKNPIIVNRLFQYKTGSYTEGNLSYPLHLQTGKHTAKIKVWNVFNISATASIEFQVNDNEKFQVFDFYSIPNPVRTGNNIAFYFSHNAEEKLSRCEISVYNLMGTRITGFTYDLSSNHGYIVGPLNWNFANSGGALLQKGLYIVSVKVITESGFSAKTSDKIIFVGQ